MIVRSVILKSYRNYKSQQVSFGKNLNVVVGKNAQGKTNLIEAIFLCAIGKSPRVNKDKDLILWGEGLSKIELNVEKLSGSKKIEIYLSKDNTKIVKINGVPIKKIGELMGVFNAIYFSPDELKLVKEAPDERRRFMDIDLSQFNKRYFYTLSKYNKILAQRNKLLKDTINAKVLADTLPIWNEQLAVVASYIIKCRIELIEQLKVHTKTVMHYLTDEKENVELSYVGIAGDSEEEIKNKLLEGYAKSLEKDIKLRYTTVGPHRDDFKIVVNNIDIRNFGSQGQQRTCALALKLAELESFYARIGEYPVLLLDDVLSELDPQRQAKLLSYVGKVQTILSGTEFGFDIAYNRIVVENGEVIGNKVVRLLA